MSAWLTRAHADPDARTAACDRARKGAINIPPAMSTGAQKFKILDVRPNLARGEEPLPLIRAHVDALAPGQGVTIIAPFMPAPLIELLKSEGFQARMEHHIDGSWAVSFWRE